VLGLAVVGFALAVKVPFGVEPPGRDQGIFLTEAWLMLQGYVPYLSFFENKPPGVLVTYAAALAAFGEGMVAVHLADWVATTMTALILCQIVLRAGAGAVAALVSGGIYLAYASGPLFGGFWVTAQAEIFMDPLVALCLWWLLDPVVATAAGRWRFGLAGLCIGVVLFFKYSAAPLLLLGLVPRPRGIRVAYFAGGAASIGILVLGTFAGLGALDALLESTIEFNLAYREAFSETWGVPLFSRLLPALRELAAPYLLAGVAVATGWHGETGLRRATRAGAALWVLSLICVDWQGKYWPYHYQVLLLPLALLAGLGAPRLVQIFAAWMRPRRATIVATLVAVLLGTGYIWQVADYLQVHHLPAYWLGSASREEMQSTYRMGGTDYAYVETVAAAARVAETTDPDERILVWGYEPFIYFLARRLPATRFLYDFPITADLAPDLQARMLKRLHADLKASPPSVILVVSGDRNRVEPLGSASQLQKLPSVARFVRRGYRQAWKLGDFRGFERRARR
jgi:hypothetical protein